MKTSKPQKALLPVVGLLAFGLLTGCVASEDNNRAPSVTASEAQSVSAGDTVILTAESSDTGGVVSSYLWTQESGTPVTLSNADTATATFTAPVLAEQEVLGFQVRVTDNEGASSTDQSYVTVAAGLAAPAELIATLEGNVVTLDWENVENASTYNLYRAFESFSSISDLSLYATLDGADLIEGLERSTRSIQGLIDGVDYFFVVTALNADGIESRPSLEVSRRSNRVFQQQAPLNDTTVSQCLSEAGALAECGLEDMPGQDAETGRTAAAIAEELDKVGSGVASFDFSSLDGDGVVVGATDDEGTELSDGNAQCVRDNHTGLIWELKLESDGIPDDDLRLASNRYSWFSSDSDTNGGNEGLRLGPECGGGYCNTQAYANRLNQLELCGRGNWRLPSVLELRNIADIAGLCDDGGENCWFPLQYVWSNQTYAADVSLAWLVSLRDGQDAAVDKQEPRSLIMVSDSLVEGQ